MRSATQVLTGRGTRTRLVVMAICGLVGALIVGVTAGWRYSPTFGWAVACAIYIGWVWLAVGRMTPQQAEVYATREDPNRATSELLIILASLSSLIGVLALLIGAKGAVGLAKELIPVLALVSVALSWFLIHTLFTLRYASLYYSGTNGGIDFNEDEPPNYLDFAYVSFTVGMTYQISDTDITSRTIRATALRHALLSYLFGAVILASTINLVAGLAS